MAVVEHVDPRTEVIKRRLRGKSYESISADLGLSLDKVKDYFRAFLADNYSDLGEVELRLTQLARLEKMVDFLWDTVQAGDLSTEGKQTANLLKVIEALNDLMALHRDPLRDAQVQLTQVQTELVHTVLSELRMHLLTNALHGLREVITGSAEGVDPQVTERLVEVSRTRLEASWSEWFANASDKSVQLVRAIENKEA